MLHNNLNGWSGGNYSLYDNLWLFTAGDVNGGGVFIAPRTGWYLLTGCGGGGAGGGVNLATAAGGGGGSGARCIRLPVFLMEGEIVPVQVGRRGFGVNGANGGAGIDTTFGSYLTLGGGLGGIVGNGGTPIGAGGAAGPVSGILAGEAFFAENGNPGGNGSGVPAGGLGVGPGFPLYGKLGNRYMDNILIDLIQSGDGVPGTTSGTNNNGVAGQGYGVSGSGAVSTVAVNRIGGNGTPGILFIEMPLAA
jgi:hypothetical protein